MTYGPAPWRQTQWDARAAVNFMAGGTGSGLVVAGAALAAAGAPPELWVACTGAGLAFVAAGLTAVWFEIGRPLRALNVVLNPGSSWMARESMIAGLLFASALALCWTRSVPLAAPTALFALAFAYAQGRLLRAAKGIPAWHDAAIPVWIVASALVEGGGLAVAIAAWVATGSIDPAAVRVTGAILVVGVVLRAGLWRVYRSRVERSLVAGAARALDAAGHGLMRLGTALPAVLSLAAIALAGLGPAADAALAAAGVLAWLGGWRAKYALVCRASFNRGFSLAHLPVRGRR